MAEHETPHDAGVVRILLLSDLHLEFAPVVPPDLTDIDVVVLAGDIGVGAAGVLWALDVLRAVPVVYVLGNHEYYGQSFARLALDLREFATGTNVHVLERQAVTIAGVRFLGCTLWTDLALFGHPKLLEPLVGEAMSDYEVIQAGVRGQRKLTTSDTLGNHRRSRKWLERELYRSVGTPTVVVTHHAPSLRSIAEKDRDDLLCCGYASALDEFVERTRPALWLHGHVHESADYRIGATRVAVNARGYPVTYGRSNPEFDLGWVIELPLAPSPAG